MGTFAETAIVNYRLSIADEGKQTSFLFAAIKRKFAVSVFRLQQTNRKCVCIFILNGLSYEIEMVVIILDRSVLGEEPLVVF
jgi:hypothetical protein